MLLKCTQNTEWNEVSTDKIEVKIQKETILLKRSFYLYENSNWHKTKSDNNVIY